MKLNLLRTKKKKLFFGFFIIIIILFFYLFSIVSTIVREGYDQQNKLIEITKSIIPKHYIKKIKENLFFISDLKARNEYLEIQLKKFEQGLRGEKFKSEIISLNSEKYRIEYFFTPFKRLDVNKGWNADINSLRAHYTEIKNDKIFLISGEGQTIFFDKKNLFKDSLSFKNLNNNIGDILKVNNSRLIGIRDLFFYNDKILISMMTENKKGITINLYIADLNYEKINFEIFFETGEYWKNYNVFSGGRIEKFNGDNILFAIGYAHKKDVSQELDSLLGKIIKINLLSKDHQIISIGHRNPQGLKYLNKYNLVINSEHGPKGGDEININKLGKGKEIKNYGWDIASYGIEYDGTDPYKKSHSEFGFQEPSIYYVPSIGISEIVFMEKNSFCEKKCLWTSSLRAHSLYLIEIDDNFEKFTPKGRILLKNNRIRDIDYDEELDLIILMSENIPAIITIKKI